MTESLKNHKENAVVPRGHARAGNVVEYSHHEALSGESYEAAARSLDEIEALQQFRANLSKQPFGSFYDIFEDITVINQSPLSDAQKAEQTQRVIESMGDRAGRFSPRVADLYGAILARLSGTRYEAKFEMTQKKVAELETTGDLQVLVSGTTSWELKLNRIDKRLDGYLKGARALDKKEGNLMSDDERKQRQEKLEKINKAPSQPAERSNESKPSMDEMERLKEGERAPAIWSITPAYGGYYREQSFSQWDSTRNVWREPQYAYSDIDPTPLCETEDSKRGLINLTMQAEVVCGRWTSLPLPYTHGLHKIEAGSRTCHVRQDQNGDMVVMVEGEGAAELTVIASPQAEKRYGTMTPAPQMPAEFSEETKAKIVEIEKTKRGNILRARALASYTRRRLEYSNESKYNNLYDTYEKGYFAAIDEYRKADCDVGNTYFAALCAQLNIPVRHVVGHSVKGKDVFGTSAINSGTGHGWSEVWDDQEHTWVRIDATSAGDPNLEEQNEPGQAVPGDYGSQEAVSPTDEQLEELRQKLSEKKEQLSYTKEERQLAEDAGVDLKEARQIVKEIHIAEDERLPTRGRERIMDVLSLLFHQIVESRKQQVIADRGPVTLEEGGEEIESIVAHRLATRAGIKDPATRLRPDEEEKIESSYGGFDVYISSDKSGSMGQTDENGEEKLKVQRRVEYLMFGALHAFSRVAEKAGLRPQHKQALAIRTQGISFRGSGPDELDLDKPLGSEFTASDKVALWHSLSQQGWGNGDTASLKHIYEQIKAEVEEENRTGTKSKRLRLVVACSDGEPDSAEGVQDMARKLGELGCVVVGVGLTESASKVPIIFDTPYSRGDFAKSIGDFPAIVAKHIVMEAIKLFSPAARKAAEQRVNAILAKFNLK